MTMRENFLHYLWRYKKFDVTKLKTTAHETIDLISVGEYNLNSGPDFFNAKLNIDNQIWVGNVEIHIKSSDWFVHNHQNDKAYDNVILHVVWEDDAEIFRADNSIIPTIELKSYVSSQALSNYHTLFNKSQKWINCENEFATIDDFVLENWMERLFFERLEKKAIKIDILLKKSNNNWEDVLFKMITKNFGLSVNGDAFLSVAQSLDFSMIRKQQKSLLKLEAILFGQAGLLEESQTETYFEMLKTEYLFLKQKFKLSNSEVIPLKFFRLRPSNFPTIRLAQLANLLHLKASLFSKIITLDSPKDFYKLFSVGTSVFWETHYTFSKESKRSSKMLTKSFINLLLINTIIPLKFAYAKHKGKLIEDTIIQLINMIPSETNGIVRKYNALFDISHSALHSQALIQLKTKYCDKNKCLECAVGNVLLNRNM